MNKWDRRFLEMAELVSTWSKDPSTKVGAVIVRNRKVVATGYNGLPRGIKDDDRLNDRGKKYPLIVHAEMNAIIQAGRDAEGSTMYMFFPYGGVPCGNCSKHLITAGIVRLVIQPLDPSSRWAEEQVQARETLREAGVAIYELS